MCSPGRFAVGHGRQLDQALRRIAEAAKAARLSSVIEDILAERLILSLSLMATAASSASASR